MAKAIYICSRSRSFGQADEDRLRGICESLTPDNIDTPVSHRVVTDDRIAFAVMNNHPLNIEKGRSLLLGYLYERADEWNKPLTDFPDGSYAIFRSNETHVEVVTDPVASRTVWYYFDEERFIASTSQRAIVMFLGSFEFDERVIPWMLSSGTLGPKLSWDSRIAMLPTDSSIILDRKNWSISISQNPFRYDEKSRSDAEHRRVLEEAVAETLASLKEMDLNGWALTLSGGYDSRAILSWLKGGGYVSDDFRTVTWGLKRSFSEERNDAKIAKEVADSLGVRHTYFPTDVSKEPVEVVIDRFLSWEEGRSDHISAYMDGMKVWRDLLEDGIQGVIMGYQLFGWWPVSSEVKVRLHVGCQLCSDQSNLADAIERFGLPSQELPDDLMQKDESLLAMRDRLYITYRQPTFIAAMADIKFSYMEQISPLLSRMILERTMELPDRLRVNKGLYIEMVDDVSPDLPYADKDKGGPALLKEILREGAFVELMLSTLKNDYARILFSEEFLDWIEKGIKKGDIPRGGRSGTLKKTMKRLVPSFIKNRLLDSGAFKPGVDGNVLAFRVFIIIRMHQILSEECTKFGTS